MGDAIGVAAPCCSPAMLLAESAKCQGPGDGGPGPCLLSIRKYPKNRMSQSLRCNVDIYETNWPREASNIKRSPLRGLATGRDSHQQRIAPIPRMAGDSMAPFGKSFTCEGSSSRWDGCAKRSQSCGVPGLKCGVPSAVDSAKRTQLAGVDATDKCCSGNGVRRFRRSGGREKRSQSSGSAKCQA